MVEVSIFCKLVKTSGQTVWPIKIKTVALLYFYILSWLPSLQTSFVCFGHIQSINEVTPAEVSIFQKLAKIEVSKISTDQDRKATSLYLIFAAQASNFYHGFYDASDIFSPKIKTLCQR